MIYQMETTRYVLFVEYLDRTYIFYIIQSENNNLNLNYLLRHVYVRPMLNSEYTVSVWNITT